MGQKITTVTEPWSKLTPYLLGGEYRGPFYEVPSWRTDFYSSVFDPLGTVPPPMPPMPPALPMLPAPRKRRLGPRWCKEAPMELSSARNPSVLPQGYGRQTPGPLAPLSHLPRVTLGQLAHWGDMDLGSAYAAMKSGQVPKSIQSRYFGYAVEPGQRKDFQTDAQTAYSLYLDGKIPEHEALDAIYRGQVPEGLQDRFPEIDVLPGTVDEDPSYRFWNAFGLGSLANPNESLLSKIGLMTVGGGLLNIVGKPLDLAQTEILHAADPSDTRTFGERLLHQGDVDKTVKDNFFHSGFIGSRLDPEKYAADAERYDHNGVTQAGAGLLRLAGLDGLVEAVNDDGTKTPLYRGLKGGMSVLGAASQVLPFTEGLGAGVGRGLGAVGRGLGRGASAVGRGAQAVGRGVARAARGPAAEVPYGKSLTTASARPYGFHGVGEADVYAATPVEAPLRTGSMDELVGAEDEPAPVSSSARVKAVRAPQAGVLGLPRVVPEAVDPETLLDRDPATLSGAEKDALFDFKRSQREALARLNPEAASGLLGDEAAVDEVVGSRGEAASAPAAPDAQAFDRSVTQALKTSQRRLSDQALFTDTRDVLGRAQAAESLADETLAGMKQTSLAADQVVNKALDQLQDAPDFDDAEPEAHPFRRDSRLRQGVRRQGNAAVDDLSAAFARLYGEAPGVATGEAVVAGPVEVEGPAVVENRTNAARAAQLRKIEALGDEPPAFQRGSAFRRPVKPGNERPGTFQRQGSIRGSLAAPKRGLADLNWGPKPQSVMKRLGLGIKPQEEMVRHLNRFGLNEAYTRWLSRNQKVATPDSYYEYLLINQKPLLSEYRYDYHQPMYGHYEQPKLPGDDPSSLAEKHQRKYGLDSKRYKAWLKREGVGASAKAYHDYVRETQSPRLYQRLGYVA
ncbi:MAG: hypothetical protein ABW150_18765 [Candidatus Thiodiazotropha sp.]